MAREESTIQVDHLYEIKAGYMIDRAPFYEQCAIAHPLISTNGEVLDGVPHLEGTSLTVSQVLARVYVHGSIAAVVEYYADVSEEQIKEAISYAQTFMEAVSAARGDRDQ